MNYFPMHKKDRDQYLADVLSQLGLTVFAQMCRDLHEEHTRCVRPHVKAYHSTEHMEQVAVIAHWLLCRGAKESWQVSVSDFILVTACLCHDIGHSFGREDDAYNVKCAIEAFHDLAHSMAERGDTRFVENADSIVGLISMTQYPYVKERTPKNLIERCIRDADILYGLQYDSAESIMALRLELRMTGSERWSARQFIESRILFLSKVEMFTPDGMSILNHAVLSGWHSHILKYTFALMPSYSVVLPAEVEVGDVISCAGEHKSVAAKTPTAVIYADGSSNVSEGRKFLRLFKHTYAVVGMPDPKMRWIPASFVRTGDSFYRESFDCWAQAKEDGTDADYGVRLVSSDSSLPEYVSTRARLIKKGQAFFTMLRQDLVVYVAAEDAVADAYTARIQTMQGRMVVVNEGASVLAHPTYRFEFAPVSSRHSYREAVRIHEGMTILVDGKPHQVRSLHKDGKISISLHGREALFTCPPFMQIAVCDDEEYVLRQNAFETAFAIKTTKLDKTSSMGSRYFGQADGLSSRSWTVCDPYTFRQLTKLLNNPEAAEHKFFGTSLMMDDVSDADICAEYAAATLNGRPVFVFQQIAGYERFFIHYDGSMNEYLVLDDDKR